MKEILAGATAEISEQTSDEYFQKTIPEVLAMPDGTDVIVSGTVSTINYVWNNEYNNMSVTITDADGNELYVYKLGTKVERGDYVTIKGVIGSYNGKKEILEGATAEIHSHTEIPKTPIDPFEGIQLIFRGISPYCTLHINNENCSEDAQLYVIYSADKEEYKNGDIVTITASFINAELYEEYEMTSTTYTYTVENQAEYITSINDTDLAGIRGELQDYITAKENSAYWFIESYEINFMNFNFNLYDYNNGNYFSESDLSQFELVPQGENYFSCLKIRNRDNKEIDFNKCSFIYQIKFKGKLTNRFVCVKACNIIRYADGSVSWSSEKDMDYYDFVYTTHEGTVTNAVDRLIMNYSIDYNISKIEE